MVSAGPDRDPGGSPPAPDARSLGLRVKRTVFGLLPARSRLPLRVLWMRASRTLEPEVTEVARLVPAGGTALDIGANHGVYSYFMVRHFDRVVAFEPQPVCVSTLTSWARDRVEVRQVALSDSPGEGTLSIPVQAGVVLTGYARLDDQGDGDAATTIQVPLERLDDQDISDVRFIKIDVEGHELPVLLGADHLLERDHPVVLVEIEQRHLTGGRTVADVVGHLTARGYSCWFRTGGRWAGFDEFRPEEHQDTRRLGGPDYVGMFLFLPGGGSPPG